MKALMLALMTWASAHTGLPVPEAIPHIKQFGQCSIQKIAWPGLACDEEQGPIAIYDHRTMTVYLPRSWSSDSLFHVSILLHELVHHMQAEAGMEMTGGCSGSRIELPAYQAQIDWLAAAGVDPHETMGINAFYLRLRTSCGFHH